MNVPLGMTLSPRVLIVDNDPRTRESLAGKQRAPLPVSCRAWAWETRGPR